MTKLNDICRFMYDNTSLGEDGIKMSLIMDVKFEGFRNRASEDLEYQFKLTLKDEEFKSNPFECLDDFLERVLSEEIKKINHV